MLPVENKHIDNIILIYISLSTYEWKINTDLCIIIQKNTI